MRIGSRYLKFQCLVIMHRVRFRQRLLSGYPDYKQHLAVWTRSELFTKSELPVRQWPPLISLGSM